MPLLKIAPLFAVFVMTYATPDPFPVPAIQEVEIKGGSAHATAIHGSPTWAPGNAFILGNPTGWHNGLTEMKRILPVMVWYEFPANKIFTPGRISFRLGQDNTPDQGPTIWQFVGSNDETCEKLGRWTVLCEDRTDIPFPNKYYTKYCDVSEKIMGKFRCLGISVLRTASKQGYATVRNVRMWKKVFE